MKTSARYLACKRSPPSFHLLRLLSLSLSTLCHLRSRPVTRSSTGLLDSEGLREKRAERFRFLPYSYLSFSSSASSCLMRLCLALHDIVVSALTVIMSHPVPKCMYGRSQNLWIASTVIVGKDNFTQWSSVIAATCSAC